MKPKGRPGKQSRGCGKESDVNAMYAEEDWEIVEPLLEFLKHKKVRVFDPHRDGMANETNLKIWVDKGIYNSKMSVIFLSRRWSEMVEFTFRTECAVTRFAHTVGRHRVLLVLLDSRKIPDNLRHFQKIYAWKLKQHPKDPKNKFQRGRLFWTNPYIGSDKRQAYITDEKQRRFGKTEILRHIGKVKTVFEHFELHCTFDRCTFRCQGNEVLEAYYHLQQCQFQQIACRYCNQFITKKKILKHENERCLYKKVACPNPSCNGTFPAKSVEEHKKKCPFEEVECIHAVYGCKMKFKKMETKKHLDSCQFVKIFCNGCRKEYFRRDVYSHKCEDALPMHFQKTKPNFSCNDVKRTETFNCKHQGCSFVGTSPKYQRHVVCCDYRRQRCEHCGDRFPVKDLTQHEQNCQKIDECQACGMAVPRSAKDTHEYVCTALELSSFGGADLMMRTDLKNKETKSKSEERGAVLKERGPKSNRENVRKTSGGKSPWSIFQPVIETTPYDVRIVTAVTSPAPSSSVFDLKRVLHSTSNDFVDLRDLKLAPITQKSRYMFNHLEEILAESISNGNVHSGFFEMSSYW
ncbi:Y2098-like protein [Mya arenaria]|uniref:Y2098-like protein n=1 Tax=Mya arenaria TaxID=6604 RepID=A0ABY7FQS3_MYAAR|nr:Y2098-like protein [Mya arenaria]